MATQDITAGDVMNKAAALMNDNARQVYTYVIQLPYLEMALQDLRKLLELNNSPVTNDRSAVISVPAATVSVGFAPVPPVVDTPYLPDDLIDIRGLWERPTTSYGWIPMSKAEFVPLFFDQIQNAFRQVWSWQENEIKFPPIVGANQIRIDYIKNLFGDLEDEDTVLGVINSDSYLQYRTAALLAEFVGENPTRALALNFQANQAFDVMTGIDNKSKQQIQTRRRPFRAGWKSRGF